MNTPSVTLQLTPSWMRVDLLVDLQGNLDRLDQWVMANCMRFNKAIEPTKTKVGPALGLPQAVLQAGAVAGKLPGGKGLAGAG